MPNSRTALYDRHLAQKARVVPFAGWDMPVQYAGIAAEHKAVRTGAGVFDVSHMARLSFSGPDALPLLESVFTNSVATMAEGQVRYGLVCNESGGILDDILVYRMPHNYAAVVNAGNRGKIAAWLARHAAGKAVDIKDHTDDTAMIAVQGPAAAALVQKLFTPDPAALKYYTVATVQWTGVCECVVSRTGYTGEDGFEVILPAGWAPVLWDVLQSGGAVPCGLGARDTLRLEAAMPLYGHELTEAIDPLRAGLGWAVKPDKGPFVGRDALRQRPPGPVRVGLELDGPRAAREGCPVLAPDATPVGTVTSGSFAPWLGKSIAMGYVPPELSAVGTRLLVDARGTHLPAAVVPLPFYRRAR